MKYKSTLAIVQHLGGNLVAGPHEEFEATLADERHPLFQRLLQMGHIKPVTKQSNPLGADEKTPSEEKLNLTPIVDQIEQVVAGTVISDVEQVIAQGINRALHVNAVVTPNSVQVNVPIGEAEPTTSEATPVESSDKEESSTETEVGTSKPKAKKTAKPRKTTSLKDELN